jgi:hypothetical protein
MVTDGRIHHRGGFGPLKLNDHAALICGVCFG